MDTPEVREQVAERGASLIEDINRVVAERGYGPADVAFACASMAGHAAAQVAGEDQRLLERNLETTADAMAKQAHATFVKARQTW